jgi:very-short-patch-repair endonuclease
MVRKSPKRLLDLGECALAGRKYGVERAIGGVVRAQHGVISRAQLIAIGLASAAIDKRVARGRLIPIHRGVYLVGPIAGERSAEVAAVLACSAPAWVSHESAAYVVELPPYPDRPEETHVTTTRSPRREGIRVHRTLLASDEVTEVDGVPVTTATRTIIDLAPRPDLEHLLSQAYAKRLTSRSKLLSLSARYPRRPGIPALRDLLDATPALTRSPPERRHLELIRKARLPEPRTNVRVAGWEVDCFWPERKLMVEVDALSTHTSPRAFERDRRKDAELTLRGYMVIRVTRRQILKEPEAVIARLAAALSLSSTAADGV